MRARPQSCSSSGSSGSDCTPQRLAGAHLPGAGGLWPVAAQLGLRRQLCSRLHECPVCRQLALRRQGPQQLDGLRLVARPQRAGRGAAPGLLLALLQRSGGAGRSPSRPGPPPGPAPPGAPTCGSVMPTPSSICGPCPSAAPSCCLYTSRDSWSSENTAISKAGSTHPSFCGASGEAALSSRLPALPAAGRVASSSRAVPAATAELARQPALPQAQALPTWEV